MTATLRPRVRSVLLVTGAVLGVTCVLIALVGTLLGVTPLIFRSGSMAPEIPTGSLAVARSTPAADLRIGDVVSVEDATGTRITHRVVGVEPSARGASLQLKGDANEAADAERYDVAEADRVLGHLPALGYGVAWLSGPTAVFLGGLMCGVLLMIAFGGRREDSGERAGGDGDDHDGGATADEAEARAERAASGGAESHPTETVATVRVGRRLLVVGAGTLLVAAGGLAVPTTVAAFNDTAQTTATALGTTSLRTPAAPAASQTQGTGKVALSWDATTLADNTAAAGYNVLRYSAATGGTVATVCTTTTARSCTIDPSTTRVWYAVRARYGTNWISPDSARTALTADAAAPVISNIEPDDGATALTSALRDSIASECGDSTANATSAQGRIACWSISDASAMSSVTYQLIRSAKNNAGSVTSTTCWNGSAWVAVSDGCRRNAAQAGTSATWYAEGARDTAYVRNANGTHVYELTVWATDVYNNASAPKAISYTGT